MTVRLRLEPAQDRAPRERRPDGDEKVIEMGRAGTRETAIAYVLSSACAPPSPPRELSPSFVQRAGSRVASDEHANDRDEFGSRGLITLPATVVRLALATCPLCT